MDNKESHYASFWTRLLAHNIDLMPILFLLYLVSFITPSAGYDIFIFGSIYMIYHIAFEASKWNATPGKKWSRLKVVSVENTKPQFYQTVVRNVFKIVSLLAFFGGFIMIIFTSRRRGLHDFIGGTIVLFDED